MTRDDLTDQQRIALDWLAELPLGRFVLGCMRGPIRRLCGFGFAEAVPGREHCYRITLLGKLNSR